MRRVGFAFLLLAGCYDSSAFEALPGPSGESASSSGGETGDVPSGSVTTTSTTSSSAGSASEGTAAGVTGTTSTTGEAEETEGALEPEDLPPTVSFTASPTSIDQAAPITIEVEHSPDVALLHLLDGDEIVESWTPGEEPPEYLILSSDGKDARPLRVLAVDDSEQETLSDVVWIATKLPAPGTELWQRKISLGDHTTAGAMTSGMVNGGITLRVGASADWQGLAMRLNAEGKTAMVVQPLDAGQSWVGGIVLDADGNSVVVGTQIFGNETRPWMARVSDLGDIFAVDFGKLGDAATGVDIDPVTGRLYVSGYRRTPKKKEQFDALLSVLGPDGAPVWEQQIERPLPPGTKAGDALDFGWDVAVVNSDPEQVEVVVVGESRFMDDGDNIEHRAFVRRYTSAGEPVAEWLSEPPPLKQGGARCVLADADGSLMVGGWSSSDPKVLRSATIYFFDTPLIPQSAHLYGDKGTEVVQDLGRLPNDEIVYIADVDVEEEGRHDFELRALETPLGGLLWSTTPGGDADMLRGAALAVTPHGHIVVLGTKAAGNATSLSLSTFHP